jgi:hypothetical protein
MNNRDHSRQHQHDHNVEDKFSVASSEREYGRSEGVGRREEDD